MDAEKAVNNTPDAPPSHLHEGAKRSRLRKWQLVVASILVMIVSSSVFAYSQYIASKNPTQKTVTKATQSAAKKPCFVRFDHLLCIDSKGAGRVRYDLPFTPDGLSISTLSTNPDQSAYVGTANGNGTTEIILLDKQLKVQQKVSLPSTFTPNAPTLSHDGKAIFLELSSAAGGRQIYRYDLVTSALTQLTDTGLNTQPYETADGHILFSRYEQHGMWLPYRMQADGSAPQPIGSFGSLPTILGFSYDPVFDTIFVFGTDNGQGKVAYIDDAALQAGQPITTISVPIASSSDRVVRLSKGSAIVATLSSETAAVYTMPSAKKTATLNGVGSIVGNIATSAFRPSKQQTEQPSDYIVNKGLASPSLTRFLGTVYNDEVKCQQAAVQGTGLLLNIQKVTRDQFAHVTQSCVGIAVARYYVKSHNTWREAFKAQAVPACKDVQQYSFTKEIIATCWDEAVGTEVENKNL